MRCSACQHENPEQARFCGACGSALSTVRPCPACQAENPRSNLFCHHCGERLEAAGAPPRSASVRDPRAYTPRHLAEKILTSRGALEGERKRVTVLFADLAGFTSLAEPIDPEETHGIMDRCFQAILEQVHRYEGTVNQFLGDGVMALFGAPIALEGAPRRAVLSALGIQRALAALREELRSSRGVDFGMRIGIHTGLVVVGKIGDDLRMDYTAVGDTTNLASRLQQLAEPGSIVISEATRRLVSGFFELRDRGETRVKGRKGPVHAFDVLGERDVDGRIEAVAEAGLTPLVGRDRDLDLLRAAFENARNGHGQVVFLVGDAGIGKSRLLYEFRHHLRNEPHVWLTGRCTSYGRATPFQPVVDALQGAFGLEDRDDDESALARIADVEASLGGGMEWTLPFLRQLLSLPAGDSRVEEMDPMTRRSETFRALQARVLGLSEQRPVVVAIEDVHWIDAASEELLGFLADSVPVSRALLLLTHRPGYRHPFGDRSYHVRIGLQALSENETSAMAGSLLAASDLPEDLRRLIAIKAEGNPFFIEELTRSLVEDGTLRIRNGRAELSRQPSEISVPDTIHELLMARIDRLPAEPKRAIQIASVIGREFALRLLERITEAGDRLTGVVEDLRALELIYEKASHPELAFMFKHALTHDVAYQSVLLQHRRALHRAVGTAIEELYRDRIAEHYEALAHHFARGEDWERALEYHDRASGKAVATYANHSAAEHCRQALAIAERLGESVPDERRAALEERLARVCFCLNEFQASAEAYERAARLESDGARAATHLANAGWSLLWIHDYDRAERTTQEALSLATEHGADAARALALNTRALALSAVKGMGEPEISRLAAEGDALAERSGDPAARLRLLGEGALWSEMRGDYRQAIGKAERALGLVRGTVLSCDLVLAQWALALSLGCLGQYGRALELLREALGLCDRIGDRAMKTRLLNTLGWAFAEFGCHAIARRYNEQATHLGRELVELELVPGAPELHANGSINLACNLVASGDFDAAMEHLEPIRASLDLPGDAWQRWRYSMHVDDALARVWLAKGEPEQALELIERELVEARRHASRKIEARALELRGRALTVMDHRPEAMEALRAALEVATAIEYPPVLWRSHSLLSEIARRGGDRSGAEGHAARVGSCVGELSRLLPDPDLKREFTLMGERLVADPLGAYR